MSATSCLLPDENRPILVNRYTIHGGKDIPELELSHLDGHKGQKPVRIGNGAADHLQLDIYGELLDASEYFRTSTAPLWQADDTGAQSTWRRSCRSLVSIPSRILSAHRADSE